MGADFVCDLREGRLKALAVRLRADAKLQHAVGRQAREALLVSRHHGNAPAVVDRRAVGRLLAEDGEADADSPAIGLAFFLPRAHRRDVDQLRRAAHRLGIVAAVEVLLGDVVERHLGWLH